MPHQRYIAEVGGEYDPVTGIPYYREVVVTIMRQHGKTTLNLSWQLHRCLSPRWTQPQRSAFTAQSGKDARDKFLDELFPLIRSSRKLRPLIGRINEGMGNESIRFRNGSLIRLLSTSTSSGHSKTLHQAVLDEIWHDADDRRQQGLRPAMITIPDAQLLICSTAGTDESVILNEKVEAGRLAVEQDIDSGIAYFEWSAPDDWDPDDDESFFEFMPALCPDPPCRCGADDGGWRHTITIDAVRAERHAMKPPEFARAYGNRKQGRAETKVRVIAEDAWNEMADPQPQRPTGSAFAVHVSLDRKRVYIAYAGRREDGRFLVGLVEPPRDGVRGVAERMAQLRETWNPAAIVVDTRSERLTLDLKRVGISPSDDIEQPKVGDLVIPSAADTAAAYAVFVDAAQDDQLRHADDGPVNAALDVAKTRPLAGGLTWDTRGDDIGSLKAVTLALWAFEARAHLVVEGDYDVTASVY